MATAGPNIAGAGQNDTAIGTRAWATPERVTASDNSYATIATLTSNSTERSNYLKATSFGFGIPSGATINGIAVTIARYSTNSTGRYSYDAVVSLVVGGAVVGNNKADTTNKWPNSETDKTYGGVSDLWGLTPTAEEVNSSNFGVVVSIDITRSSLQTIASVDFFSITVTYTEGGGASAVPVIMNQYRQRRA